MREISAGSQFKAIAHEGGWALHSGGRVPELPRKLPASPPTMAPTVSDPSCQSQEQQKW